MSVFKKRTNCGICNTPVKYMNTILKYGKVPLAGEFSLKPDSSELGKFDLNILHCEICGLVQTDSIIDAHTLFDDYRYMSSIGLSKHFTEVASYLVENFNLNEYSRVIEIGSNDGVLLNPLRKLGIHPVGIDPAKNISQIAIDNGNEVIIDYFNEETSKKYWKDDEVDLVFAANCFAHIEDIRSVVKGIQRILKPWGHFVFEVHYVKPLIEGLQYDNIYHEHIYYHSIKALNNLFLNCGSQLQIVNVEEIPIHSGSIRVTCEKIPENIWEWYDYEENIDYENFSKEVLNSYTDNSNYIRDLANDGMKIVGYGASGRANMMCNICGLRSDIINYIVDESPERAGRYIAGTDIPIVPLQHLLDDEKKPDIIFIFAWNFAKMIIKKLNSLGAEEWEIMYYIPLPKAKFISSNSDISTLEGI